MIESMVNFSSFKILLVEPSEQIGELITKNLQKTFEADVLFVQTSKEGVQALRSISNYQIIIVRNHLAIEIVNAHYDLSLQTSLIVIGELDHVYKKYVTISEQLRLEELNRHILKNLGMKKEDFDHLKMPEYVPFPLKHFFLMTKSPCDIFNKVVKKNGEGFVKRLKKGDAFLRSDLEKYQEFGIDDLYIFREDFEIFIDGLVLQSVKSLQGARSMDEAVDIASETYGISSDILRTLGITPICLTIVNQTLQSIKSQIQQSAKLGPLLKKILEDQHSYSYKHSYLICALTYSLLPKMEWGSGDQQASLFEKLCLVSYFHDVYLEDEKLLKINSFQEFRDAKLSLKESEQLLNHAHHAATLMLSYPRLPQGVDVIIKQHHGSANGVGLPEVLTTNISPMAIFFIVVEEFAKQVLALEASPDQLGLAMKTALLPLKEKFQLPSYRKIVLEIENMIAPKSV